MFKQDVQFFNLARNVAIFKRVTVEVGQCQLIPIFLYCRLNVFIKRFPHNSSFNWLCTTKLRISERKAKQVWYFPNESKLKLLASDN